MAKSHGGGGGGAGRARCLRPEKPPDEEGLGAYFGCGYCRHHCGHSAQSLLASSTLQLKTTKWGTLVVDESRTHDDGWGLGRGRYHQRRIHSDQRHGVGKIAAEDMDEWLTKDGKGTVSKASEKCFLKIYSFD
jgi:hypothetical protein